MLEDKEREGIPSVSFSSLLLATSVKLATVAAISNWNKVFLRPK